MDNGKADISFYTAVKLGVGFALGFIAAVLGLAELWKWAAKLELELKWSGKTIRQATAKPKTNDPEG